MSSDRNFSVVSMAGDIEISNGVESRSEESNDFITKDRSRSRTTLFLSYGAELERSRIIFKLQSRVRAELLK